MRKFSARDILERVLYKDGMALVLDKPSGLAVHPGPGQGQNLGEFLSDLSFGKTRRPELAHRLDRDTSGCLVLGRHPKAVRALSDLFSMNKVEKVYWAWVAGSPPADEGEISAPLEQLSGPAIEVRVSETGLPSVTHYRMLLRVEGRSMLELRPATGRTHQLRVHCAHLGCPILGDTHYGRPYTTPMLLHARSLSLPLYPKREALSIVAPTPEYWPAG